MKNIFSFSLTLALTIMLTGCLGGLIEFSCMFTDDEEHCYQSAAIQQSEPEDCEKVITERFTRSNPPKDKCYLLIAENTGDPSVCDEIVGGPNSYTRSGCLNSVLSDHHPDECSDSLDEVACRTVYATYGKGCGNGFEFVSGVCDPIVYEEEVEFDDEEAQDIETMTSHLSNAEKEDINSFYDAAKGKYMELLEADIENSRGSRKAGLEAYKDFLERSSEGYGEATTAFDNLMEMKKIFLDAYDPANDIENFDVKAELDPGFVDQVKERLFGPSEASTGMDKENEDAETALSIYEKMLEQQADNDFMQQNLTGRLSGIVVDKIKGELTDKVTEQATEIAQNLGGKAFGAVGPVAEALQSFQDGAQKEMFIAMARAYNRRRAAVEKSHSHLSDQEKRELTVRQVKADPYRDNTSGVAWKHGNILLNPDCQDGGNPLCIDDRVFWVAMDKTFIYNRGH